MNVTKQRVRDLNALPSKRRVSYEPSPEARAMATGRLPRCDHHRSVPVMQVDPELPHIKCDTGSQRCVDCGAQWRRR